MKLSKKGLDKIWDELRDKAGCRPSLLDWLAMNRVLEKEIEFEQDDFEDTVVLTVQEACEILDYLSYLDILNIKDEFLAGLPHSCKKLLGRIEQAEVEDEAK